MLLIHVIMLSVVTKLASQRPILPSINPQDSENLALVMSKNVALKMNKSDCYVCHLMPVDGRGWPMLATPYGMDDWLSFKNCARNFFTETVDMGAIAAVGNFSWSPICSNKSLRLDLVTDRPSMVRAVSASKALELLCRHNKTLPCQWTRDKIRLTEWTHRYHLDYKGNDYFGVFIYNTPTGPWQCDWQTQEAIKPTGERDVQLISQKCGGKCVNPSQTVCPRGNDPRVVVPMPAVTVNSLVCLSFLGTGTKLGTSHCNHTVTVRVTSTPLVAPKWSAFACGKSAYTVIPVNASGICYLAHLIPPSRVVDKITIHDILQSQTSTHHHRKREVGEVEQWIGVILAPLGIRNLQKDAAAIRQAFEQTSNQTLKTIQAIQTELTATRELALQNRMALDLLFASQGGTCKIIGKECCIYISDATSSVDDLDQIVKQANKNIHANQGLLSNSFQQGVENFMNSLGGWTRYIFLSLGAIAIIIMAVFALMYCCCYCSPMICHLMHQSPKPARTQQESLEYVSEKLDKTIV